MFIITNCRVHVLRTLTPQISLVFIVTVLFAELLAGCGPKYGGRRQLVELTTDPPDATAYVLTYRTWLEHGGQESLSDSAFLSTYRRKEGTTPLQISLEPYEHVFVAEWNGHREFRRFTPKAGNTVKLSLPATHRK